jgi:hypothetical protein
VGVAVGAEDSCNRDLIDPKKQILNGDFSFHGKGKRFRSSENSCTGGGTFVGVARKIAAETILPIKASSSSFLSLKMLSKHPLDGPVKIVKRLADPCGGPEFDHLISAF